MAEGGEVSVHKAKVFKVLHESATWLTSSEVASRAGIAERTARQHLLRLANAGLVEKAEVFPGYRYRLNREAEVSSETNRLLKACEVLGVSLPSGS